jgi:hypothetical protein
MADDPCVPFGQLLFRGQSGWLPLPGWARFMLAVGARAAIAGPEGRLVVALSLPVRGFAATLVGASTVVTAFRDHPPVSDANAHFDHLASLPEGTAIAHHRANSVQQGRLLGVEVSPDDDTLRVRIQLRKEQRCLPIRLCTEIRVIDDPGTLKVTKRRLVKEPGFLSHVLPGVDIASLSATTRLDCVMVGVQHALAHELLAREFGAEVGDGIQEGNLQAIARARDVAGSTNAYRSAVIPASAEEGVAPLSASTPLVVIFDGARAFSNWRSRWPNSNWVVLLDRGSPSAEEGAAAVNQGYATRLGESDALAGLDAPAGVEVLTYVERR